MEMLNEGLHTKLTFVTAPGGYGKTTALSQWLQQSDIPAAWVSLDSQDNDLYQFWSYIIAAFDSKTPSFATECMRCTLSEHDISTFVHRTEGWISGLHLAAISLQDANRIIICFPIICGGNSGRSIRNVSSN
ncbi:hypothetical protein [Paenibacillus sp. tmac-D7]|uniref:hypothetical protein n=1 Tax=Paenibacillus sp. tmac-D7 TaxID=2591462 RepID=UPI0011439B05|nr:hypothetical protein [Paenibacillus sp. tmac-D7]